MIPSWTTTSTTLNIVVDTNQFLSVFVFRGMMMQLVFDLVLEKKINMYISLALKNELLEKFQFFKVSDQVQDKVMSFIEQRGILIEPVVKVDVCRDKKDNFVLELAESSKADYIITRDKDLLELPNKRWKNTKIVKPEEFLSYLRRNKLLK